MKSRNSSTDLASMREEYSSKGLDPKAMPPQPFRFWEKWLDDAVTAGLPEPNAMVLSTVAVGATSNQAPQPSTRTVLCKGASPDGFDFYTNYESRKSTDLKRTPTTAATFPWFALSRQVNVVGRVEQTSASRSDQYWSQRTRGSQLGAWASSQSEKIASYEELEQRYKHFDEMYPGAIPRPHGWGGWRIVPETVEFWQGRQNRLHDRLVYYRSRSGRWTLERLSP